MSAITSGTLVQRRASRLVRWRLFLAGAGVVGGLMVATPAWAGKCTMAAPTNPEIPNAPGVTCNCDTAAAKDNVWKCTGGWTCTPSAASPTGYQCSKGSSEPGSGRAPSGSGGGSGGAGPASGTGVPGKTPPRTTK